MAAVALTLIWALLKVVYLSLRGHYDPVSSTFNSFFFVPDSSGWMLPAVMDHQPVYYRPFGLGNVRFFLWTKQNSLLPRQLMIDHPSSLKSSPYSTDNPTKVFIHGFGQSAVSEFIVSARDAYFRQGNFNVIAVDWYRLARSPYYLSAATNTKEVGLLTAQFIDFLVSQGSSLSSFHVLGYSLGAHAAGWVGSTLKSGQLPRITAFDPPFPSFEGPTARRRLNKNDALFVDVIHTNARSNRNKAVGFEIPLGHADFYPNGGSVQPGCDTSIGIHRTGCSHRRSSQYYVSSISKKYTFSSVPCSSYKAFTQGQCGNCKIDNSTCVLMGEYVSTSASGTYYLKTSSSPPYSLD